MHKNDNSKGTCHVIFDFDHTMIDCNSDTYIFDNLSPDLVPVMKEAMTTTHPQWTQLMQHMINLLLTRVSIKELESCLETCPLTTDMQTVLQSLHANRHTVTIASDANTFFIETILKKYNMLQYVNEIYSNYCTVDRENNSVTLVQFCEYINKPHSCDVCPINMCKGEILQRLFSQSVTQIPSQKTHYDRIVYVGDGTNDYCPGRLLTTNDHLFVRKGYRLDKFINNGSPHNLQCNIHYWTDYSDLHKLFLDNEII